MLNQHLELVNPKFAGLRPHGTHRLNHNRFSNYFCHSFAFHVNSCGSCCLRGLVSYGQPVVGWNSVSDHCSPVSTQEVMMKMRFILQDGSEYRLDCYGIGGCFHKTFICNGFVNMNGQRETKGA